MNSFAENLVFSLNATVPIFILMLLGTFFKKIKLFNEKMTAGMNTFVFKAALPVLVFRDLAGQDFTEAWDTKFVVFCFSVTLLSTGMIALFAKFFINDKGRRGEFVQASYRSSAALLGIAFITNIYGNSGMAPLMIIACVPLYNIIAVIVLELTADGGGKVDRRLIGKTLYGIVTNPIILGIVAGMIFSLLKIPQTVIFKKTIDNLANLATPMGLMAMGASFDINKAKADSGLAVIAAVIKLVLLVVIFVPIAVLLGFRESELVAILVMLGSATTVSCYVMAKNMGHEGTLTASAVMLTTLFSAFTLTLWLYILKSFALI